MTELALKICTTDYYKQILLGMGLLGLLVCIQFMCAKEMFSACVKLYLTLQTGTVSTLGELAGAQLQPIAQCMLG